jgi:hypothetical protein
MLRAIAIWVCPFDFPANGLLDERVDEAEVSNPHARGEILLPIDVNGRDGDNCRCLRGQKQNLNAVG